MLVLEILFYGHLHTCWKTNVYATVKSILKYERKYSSFLISKRDDNSTMLEQ